MTQGFDESAVMFEKAFDLARTGRYRNSSEIFKALYKEGYRKTHLDLHFSGLSFRKQLNTICKNSIKATS